ncbi:MAG TPA: ERF family protein [Candidatus Scybalomonas excrementigallinarum]|nr:ERF family protein [Candidatus Scybalomonas excrementigallinarum]
MENKKLNESIIEIRVKLQNSKIKKSGKNKFAGFDYFELADFLPRLNELMLEEGINDNFKITNEVASLTLIKGEEKQEYTMPFVLFKTPLNKSGQPSMQDIQYLGALNTYYKRYLYLNAFGIVENDVIDKVDNDNLKVDEINYRNELVKYCKENNIDINEIAKDYKLNAQSNNEEFKKVLNELDKKIFE